MMTDDQQAQWEAAVNYETDKLRRWIVQLINAVFLAHEFIEKDGRGFALTKKQMVDYLKYQIERH